MFYIPSIQTIKEYNNLKTTKQPVKMTRQITEMDKFVYDKYSGLKNIALLGSNVAAWGFYLKHHLSTPKADRIPLVHPLTLFATFLFMTLWHIFPNKNYRNNSLTMLHEKQRLYEKQGLNAVI